MTTDEVRELAEKIASEGIRQPNEIRVGQNGACQVRWWNRGRDQTRSIGKYRNPFQQRFVRSVISGEWEER